MSVLEQVQADVRTAMKAGEKDRAAALRLVVDSLQKDAKLGDGDEVAVLQRERKKRIEAADAYAEAGREEQAAAERFEAELIEAYLPAQLSDEELVPSDAVIPPEDLSLEEARDLLSEEGFIPA